ncbi:unnamed protein product [Gongylonema pulchrum]|uniref:Prothymosin alpha n=1 Tax=Gongylonema pulchrum TaxID=637853 RepID=A0A183ESG5_9BILA|nr:unnamed protein product [Gongylonema pulchrum]
MMILAVTAVKTLQVAKRRLLTAHPESDEIPELVDDDDDDEQDDDQETQDGENSDEEISDEADEEFIKKQIEKLIIRRNKKDNEARLR